MNSLSSDSYTWGYREAIDRLLSLVDHERGIKGGPRQKQIFNLDRITVLLDRLGNPHLKASTLHVAGTKGKGSTAAFCDAALSAAGFRTGFYSSPHMHSFRERIRLDSQPVTEAQFSGLASQVWPHQLDVSEGSGLGPVTLFEFMTAMGFQCFGNHDVDFQTIEVGLGGRLDATNVVAPAVCLITSISLDHTAILGDTLAEIASEKAGIIKNGVPVVVAPQAPPALSEIERACSRAGVLPILVGQDVTWNRTGNFARNAASQALVVNGRLGRYQLDIPLLGAHQLENAATAVAALEVLKEGGQDIPAEAISQGFARVSWPCRMEVLSRAPLLVVDGAHNLHSMDALVQSLPQYFDYRNLVLVTGFSRDKSVADMVKRLSEARPTTVFAAASRHPRSLPSADVVYRFSEAGVEAAETSSPADALSQAMAVAGKDDLVLATGSLFLAAEVREAVLGIQPEMYPDLLPSPQPSPKGRRS